MGETESFYTQIEPSKLVPLVFRDIPYEAVYPGGEYVLRKMKAARAINPVNDEEWLALGARWSALRRGRYHSGESLLMFRASGVLVQMYVDLGSGNAHGEYELAEDLTGPDAAIEELGNAAAVFEFCGEPASPIGIIEEYKTRINGS